MVRWDFKKKSEGKSEKGNLKGKNKESKVLIL